jgi:hypothetical protein
MNMNCKIKKIILSLIIGYGTFFSVDYVCSLSPIETVLISTIVSFILGFMIGNVYNCQNKNQNFSIIQTNEREIVEVNTNFKLLPKSKE